jgi:L-alanine-DL-glutamate epimerase-like enolase superfamily enzyme
VKVKVGLNPDHDEAAVQAIRAAFSPHVTVRVDANMGWSSARQALEMILALAPFHIHPVEQSLSGDRLEDLAWLRDWSPVAIMVDESVWAPDDALRMIRAGTADILNVYVSEAGGLRKSMRIFELAQSAGLQCTIGSNARAGDRHRGVCPPSTRIGPGRDARRDASGRADERLIGRTAMTEAEGLNRI